MAKKASSALEPPATGKPRKILSRREIALRPEEVNAVYLHKLSHFFQIADGQTKAEMCRTIDEMLARVKQGRAVEIKTDELREREILGKFITEEELDQLYDVGYALAGLAELGEAQGEERAVNAKAVAVISSLIHAKVSDVFCAINNRDEIFGGGVQ